ncbi:hypothetical protein BATDEDRAFT_86008 [Batrachochytrium dendrobatidis JAM81]|uniref:Uncharacterized protein n=1 Tax=Batrachochytrium dendrobatidis (strain JAM81 / FGSC 10211) TaxID=684364 RepID=F4NU80_BATDJ|nr:uncharacterized protein BATDEDRAFT_86008 [Batrachochytrium dendrobatidis JAM81]EGF83586.1 hypothetical protein BATDEDRAFT_86008 [Batrachochytrium dendrobatidis JAM81]KAJ8327285.1 hypothetical protein O5D80_004688 [Batrachochytrium dendrobatidis]KAK5665327.1 hypothetical protein QVD99_008159 [Batrachochytrium dendrobatidis]|eukprot:XP_006676146.1 hypothetical protein BATDEDRAFT_86008 [Batrachochytrium dendrobatidis JAM81]
MIANNANQFVLYTQFAADPTSSIFSRGAESSHFTNVAVTNTIATSSKQDRSSNSAKIMSQLQTSSNFAPNVISTNRFL